MGLFKINGNNDSRPIWLFISNMVYAERRLIF